MFKVESFPMDQRQQFRERPEIPLPSRALRSTEFWDIVRKTISTLLIVFLMEHFIGHPAVRWSWRGGSEARNLSRCEIYTIIGERYVEHRYHSMLCFVKEPHWTLKGWVMQHLRSLNPFGNASGDPHTD